VTGSRDPLADIRGKFFKFQGISVMPTFHPAELLKDPGLKRPVWEDMQQVMQINGIAS
jgi:DNA polymerase